MFKIARTSKITQKIIDQIRTAILEGKLKPGDILPPEKELMEQFGVSKQTLRESLRALEHMGLIDVRKGIGGGAHIVEVDIEVTKQSLANFLYFKDLSIETCPSCANCSNRTRLPRPPRGLPKKTCASSMNSINGPGKT